MTTDRRIRAFLVAAALCAVVTSLTAPVSAQASRANTKFGIYYLGWHCPVSDTPKNIYHPARNSSGTQDVRDISKAIAGAQAWGLTMEFHWWGKPEKGFYCLADNETVLQQHAAQLVQAGIDFIFYDATNNPMADPQGSVQQSFDRLLDAWRPLAGGAPKIAIWVPVTAGGTMVDYMVSKLNEPQNQAMRFLHDGKPLVLSVDALATDESKMAALSVNNTMRRMWSFFPSVPMFDQFHGDRWGFMQQCGAGFKASGGTETCNQRVSRRENQTVEVVPITTAYQFYQIISDKAYAVPKFRGKTFWQQFRTAYDLAPEIVTITGWNEWIAQKGCRTPDTPFTPFTYDCDPPDSATWPDGSMVFADQYDVEYNRDIEPAQDAAQMGSYYYNLMSDCVHAYKENRLCAIPQAPVGVLEGATSSPDGFVGGWAFDPNHTSASIAVHAYFYPGTGGLQVVGGTADLPRGDVNAFFGITGAHGFQIKVPKSLYNGVTHTVYVYGIDAEDPSGNSNSQLWGAPVTFNYPNQMPIGVVDGAQGNGTVVGWAFDPNHPSEALSIHVQYYNPITWALLTTVVTSTTDYRPDVNQAFSIGGNHGYHTRYCTGAQTYVSVYAFDLNNPAAATSLGGLYVPACT